MKLINLLLSVLLILQASKTKPIVEVENSHEKLVNHYKNNKEEREKHIQFHHFFKDWNLQKII